jgi:hypothetical protein
MMMDFAAGQVPPDPTQVVDYPLRQQSTYNNAGFISIKHQGAKHSNHDTFDDMA